MIVYHEIAMIMTTVDLNDRLSFQKRNDNKIVVDIEHNYVTNDHKNLAYQAAKLMMETYQLKQGVTISIDKDIPVSAGLAGDQLMLLLRCEELIVYMN